MKRRTFRVIRVFSSAGDQRRGRVLAGPHAIPCALGRGGIRRDKREGDGGTPAGRFRLLDGFYRGDHLSRPRTTLPLRRLRPDDGWCDDPHSRLYNRAIRLPSDRSHEGMWRADRLYDVVIDLSHNHRPAVPGRGSGIFMHIARPGRTPTEGCVAISLPAMLRLLPRLGPRTIIEIVG